MFPALGGILSARTINESCGPYAQGKENADAFFWSTFPMLLVPSTTRVPSPPESALLPVNPPKDPANPPEQKEQAVKQPLPFLIPSPSPESLPKSHDQRKASQPEKTTFEKPTPTAEDQAEESGSPPPSAIQKKQKSETQAHDVTRSLSGDDEGTGTQRLEEENETAADPQSERGGEEAKPGDDAGMGTRKLGDENGTAAGKQSEQGEEEASWGDEEGTGT
jgi:hypothetical protein